MLDEPTKRPHPDIANKIKLALETKAPISKAKIADQLGVSAQAITGWQTKGTISKENLARLATICGVTVEWFLGTPTPEPDEWADIIGYAQAAGLGDGIEAQDYAETHKLKFKASSLARKHLHAADLAVLYGHGDSMLPRIHSGDAILFDTSDTRIRDEALFVILCPGVNASEYSVKQCVEFGGEYFFQALNPAGDHGWRKPRKINDHKHPITIIGRVRWIGSWED